MEARSTAGYLIKDIIFDVVRFPVWWYTAGFGAAARFAGSEIGDWAARLSLRILFRNLLKPMYGDYSASGRVISLVLRLVVFAFKVAVFVVWTVVVLALLLVWVALPLVLALLLVRSLA